MALGRRDRLTYLELPYAATGLAWNSLMSMAGGWFFLSVCEAFSLGDRSYRLPGLGAYMAEAITSGNSQAMLWGVVAMVLVIVGLDFFIWSPVLAWVQRYRLEDIPGVRSQTPFMLTLYQDSLLFQTLQNLGKRRRRVRFGRFVTSPLSRIRWVKANPDKSNSTLGLKWLLRGAAWALAIVAVYLTSVGTIKLGFLLSKVSLTEWLLIGRDTFWTLLRVIVTLILSSLWTVPVGIYLATSQRRLKLAQPVIQVLASFPAPMLYPLALTLFFKVHLSFEIASLFLMMLGVQWYVLFNVLAGAMKFPAEVRSALKLMNTSTWDRWRYLYIPCVFPSLVTGWIAAAGGAWNASIVAEFVSFQHQTLIAQGIGARISMAASQQDFALLAASLTVMVLVVIALNRGVWSRIYHIAQTRYRMDL
jgi:NitT/TauT family transport system permease protein